jgi:hypothetical protein
MNLALVMQGFQLEEISQMPSDEDLQEWFGYRVPQSFLEESKKKVNLYPP